MHSELVDAVLLKLRLWKIRELFDFAQERSLQARDIIEVLP